mmetsp:Transcript_30468/g.81142  ORF Transcript_30468/g.81142 Transcript_30468/m.81142 type:complete len:106 (-) Transcript_30468:3159-3476(-)
MRGCHFGIVEATRQGERSAAQIGDSRIANPAEEGNGGHRGGVGWGCAATKGGGEGFHCGEGQIQVMKTTYIWFQYGHKHYSIPHCLMFSHFVLNDIAFKFRNCPL